MKFTTCLDLCILNSFLSSVLLPPSVLVFFLSDTNVARVNFLRVDMRNSTGSFQRWLFGKLTISQLDFWYIDLGLQVLSIKQVLDEHLNELRF